MGVTSTSKGSSQTGRIDVHHHFIPSCYVEAYNQTKGDPSGWRLPKWSVESTKELMAELGISTSILSLTAPGCTLLSGPPAINLARRVNESAASIRDNDPSSFGFFAALPPILEDISATLIEIAHALDVLEADGITLFTRYGPGHTYLGHCDVRPIWDELDKRSAVVFIHPTHLVDTRLINPGLPQPMIDYPHETTRTAVDLIMSKVIREHPNCKIILSHAGGTLPYLATRAAVMLPDSGLSDQCAEDFLQDSKSLYYDLALSGNDYTLALLTRFAKQEHILFGSDFPFAPTDTIRTHTSNLDSYEMKGKQRWQINQGNALRLFPRLCIEGE